MRFKTLALITVLLAGTTLSKPARADEPSAALTCRDLDAPLSGVPAEAPVSLSFTADQLIAQCTSASGATLTLTAPGAPVVVTPAFGVTRVAFTVSDDLGNTATASIVITRS